MVLAYTTKFLSFPLLILMANIFMTALFENESLFARWIVKAVWNQATSFSFYPGTGNISTNITQQVNKKVLHVSYTEGSTISTPFTLFMVSMMLNGNIYLFYMYYHTSNIPLEYHFKILFQSVIEWLNTLWFVKEI